MNPDILALLVPNLGIAFGVAVAIVAIVMRHRLRIARAELRHRERLAMIDKGLEVLPDDPDGDAAARPPRYLLRGLVFTFVGIALAVAFYAQHDWEVSFAWGFVPVAIGLGNLVYYAVEGRHEAPAARALPPDAQPGL